MPATVSGLRKSTAVVALAGAALLPRLNAFTSPANEIVLAVTLIMSVAMSWFVVVLSYAVHYARKDAEHPGLRFPDEEAHGAHSVLTFLFNTNIIALLVAALSR